MCADKPLRERTATDPASKVVWPEWDPTEPPHKLGRIIRDPQVPYDESVFDPALGVQDYYTHCPISASGTRLSMTERLYMIREDFATEAELKAWPVRKHSDEGWFPICEGHAYQQIPSFAVEETLVPIYVAPSLELAINKTAPKPDSPLVPHLLMGKGKNPTPFQILECEQDDPCLWSHSTLKDIPREPAAGPLDIVT